MQIFEYYALSSPLINNGPFRFDSEGKSIIRKSKRKKEKRVRLSERDSGVVEEF